MHNDNTLLEVKDLEVIYSVSGETIRAVNNVSFNLERGTVLGMVGETGAGKTSIAKAILGILPDPPAKVLSGEIMFNGKNLLACSEREMQKIRGNKISMVFQDPMTALNPLLTIGDQIQEAIMLHQNISKAEARTQAEDMLKLVGIDPGRYDDYPHQFSGGMKQRCVIAIALSCNSELLLADEPTTALDVTIQAQVLDMMRGLRDKLGTSMVLITHDLGVIADICDRVCIVYAGEIVEIGSIEDIFDHPTHPYTRGLFGTVPKIDGDETRLEVIPGMPPNPAKLPTGCKFNPRCKYASNECKREDIESVEVSPGHFCRCCKTKEMGEY